jgi:hypothetical protein
MADNSLIRFKALVLETQAKPEVELSKLLGDINAIIIKTSNEKFEQDLLSSKDLFAIFINISLPLSESNKSTIKIVGQLRPELPVFLRHKTKASKKDVEQLKLDIASIKPSITPTYCCYSINRLAELRAQLDGFVFKNYYPPSFISELVTLSNNALLHHFQDVTIKQSMPYLVNDRFIFGELFSFIPLESDWCRGFMTIHSQQESVLSLIRHGKTFLDPRQSNFRFINDLLNEITNEIWGGLKSRFFYSERVLNEGHYKIQVPVIINHKRNVMSVGSDDPQLCILHEIIDNTGQCEPVTIHQRLVFHLDWRPELCPVDVDDADDADDSGGLEFF